MVVPHWLLMAWSVPIAAPALHSCTPGKPVTPVEASYTFMPVPLALPTVSAMPMMLAAAGMAKPNPVARRYCVLWLAARTALANVGTDTVHATVPAPLPLPTVVVGGDGPDVDRLAGTFWL